MDKRKSYRRLITTILVIGMLTSVSFATIGGYNLFRNKSADTAATDERGIKINMFDYGRTKGNLTDQAEPVNKKQSGRGYHEFRFNGGSEDDLINRWTGPGGAPRTGIVKSELNSSGSPVLAGKKGESLDYLFNPEKIQGKAYTDLTGLLKKDENNNFSFDSSKNYAELNKEENTIQLYNPVKINFPATDPGAGFLPFNSVDEARSIARRANNPDEMNNVNWFFGMTVEADFVMPKNGQLKNQDMEFSFIGDDDVWVFIDNKLVLDLGGVHDRTGGKINFNTGEVETTHNFIKNPDGRGKLQKSYQKPMWSDTKDSVFGEKFSTGSKHTIKFFYLERGATASNCMLNFNLPILPDEALTVGKYVDGLPEAGYPEDSIEEIGNTEYSFKVLEADSNGVKEPEQLFIRPGQEYELWEDGIIKYIRR